MKVTGKNTTVTGLNNQSCDRANIQKGVDLAGSGGTVSLKGKFQFDGAPVSVSKSNLTITGEIKNGTYQTVLKGLLVATGTEAGLPARDAGGYIYNNRPMNIGITSGTLENVTIQKLHFKDFFRGTAITNFGTVSNLCKDLVAFDSSNNPILGTVRNIKVLLNKFEHSERGPQAFGGVTDIQFIGNIVDGAASGIIVQGGRTGCLPLVGDILQRPGLGQGQALTTAQCLGHALTPDANGICNNNTITSAQVKATLVGSQLVCPVCSSDVLVSCGGSYNPSNPVPGIACGSPDSFDAGQPNKVTVLLNKLVPDPAFLARNNIVVGMSTAGAPDNLLIALNEFKGGNRCLGIGTQYLAKNYEVKWNFFHDCGVGDAYKALRFGALDLGAVGLAKDVAAGRAAIVTTSFTRGVNIHDNLYHNNKANLEDYGFEVVVLGQSRDTFEALGVVDRDIWVASRVAVDNIISEDLCKDDVYDDITYDPTPATSPNNIGRVCAP